MFCVSLESIFIFYALKMHQDRGNRSWVMGDGDLKMSFKYLVVDFLLLIGAFFAVNYLKTGTLDLIHPYEKLLVVFLGFWFLVSLLTKKFHPELYVKFWPSVFNLLRANVFIVFCISFFVVITGFTEFSRIQIFGTCGLLFAAEAIILTIYFVLAKELIAAQDVKQDKAHKTSLFLLTSDFLLLVISFFLINYFKRGTFKLSLEYETLFYIMSGLWIVTAFLTRKFDKRHFASYFHAISPCMKSVIFMTLIMTTLMFGLQMFHYSRAQIFSFLLLFTGLEMVLWLLYYLTRKESVLDIESSQVVRSIMKQEHLPVNDDKERREILFQPIEARMKDVYLKDRPAVFDFFHKAVNLSEITRVETLILDTSEMLNFKLISLSHTRLMINLNKLNNIRWINRYFLQAHEMLADGGYIGGRAETIEVLRKRFDEKYPKYFRELFYALHFLWARVLPKLDATKGMYFNITKGRNRAISRTEILGRLSFCGFKIIAEEYIGNDFYFVAQKVKTPSLDENPSYGPFVRFERMGFNGKLIYTYKFRTMYPYSEYLQEYVHKLNELQEGGKFKDDFRVTGYGKLMRKLWLDELPMLYNWMKGDLQLVGVRPLSRHYLSLYNEELQELRKKVKPGMVPPFYADMPKTLDEITASEERYIKAYMQRPFVTQWKYFWKSFYNIVVKKARSA